MANGTRRAEAGWGGAGWVRAVDDAAPLCDEEASQRDDHSLVHEVLKVRGAGGMPQCIPLLALYQYKTQVRRDRIQQGGGERSVSSCSQCCTPTVYVAEPGIGFIVLKMTWIHRRPPTKVKPPSASPVASASPVEVAPCILLTMPAPVARWCSLSKLRRVALKLKVCLGSGPRTRRIRCGGVRACVCTCRYGHADMDMHMQIWTCRYGHAHACAHAHADMDRYGLG